MTPELRELLELSAKAMGYEVLDRRANDGEWIWVWNEKEKTDTVWIPHLDKAQCFDMENALLIDVIWWPADTCVESNTFVDDLRRLNNVRINYTEEWENHNNDRAAARMMASLRVAAEIGRRMP